MTALASILVPIDGSPTSIAALEHAVALAEDYGARVDVLHVRGHDEFEIGSTSPATPAMRAQMESAMTDAVERADQRIGGHVTRRTEQGDPLRKIIEVASDGDYDLVVMGTHGRVGRLHAMLGSVAEGVVRNAPCPVLTVREPGGEYQSFAERRHRRSSLGEQAGSRH